MGEIRRSIARSLRALLVLVFLLVASAASAAQLVVYIDGDNNAATGCTIALPAPTGGTFAGAEYVLTTVVDTSTPVPTVGAITVQTCASPPSTLAAAIPVSPGGWPVGVGNGTGGSNAIETFFPEAALSGTARLGFLYSDPSISGGNDALTTVNGTAGGAPILLALAGSSGPVGAPLLSRVGTLLLALAFALAAAWTLRRYRASATFALALIALLLSTTTIAITLDGFVTDWAGISAAATDANGDAPAGADITGAFAKFEPGENRIYFRVDARTALKPTISSANATTFTVGAAGTFAVTTTGVPVPSIARGGGALPGGVSFADNGNGTGTLSGTPTAAGTFPITFTATNSAGSSAAQNFALTVNQSGQTIAFTSTAPSNAKFGGATYAAAATASSGLPVTLTIDAAAAAVCTISGSTVSFIGTGTCVIDANQAGNSNYSAAPLVQQSFVVAPADQTIAFTSTAPANAKVGGATYAVSATATSGLPVALSIDAASAAVCSIAGSTVSFIAPGTCVVDANQAGNANYNAAPQVPQSFTVAKGDQAITFTSAAPANASEGLSPYLVTATSTSGLAVVFSIDAGSAAICSISGGNLVHFVSAGTCVIDADQPGDANWNAAAQMTQSVNVAVRTTTNASLPFADGFNQTDGTPLSLFWTEQSGHFAAASNHIGGQNAEANIATLKGINVSDVDLQVDVALAATGQSAALVARTSALGARDGYQATMTRNGANTTVTIDSYSLGVATPLATATVASSSGTLRFQLLNVSLKVFINNQLIAYAQDETWTSGSVGVRGSIGATLDNFFVTPFGTNASIPFTETFTSPSNQQLPSYWIEEAGRFNVVAATATGQASSNTAVLRGVSTGNSSVTINATIPIGATAGAVARYQGTFDKTMYVGEVSRDGAGVYSAAVYRRVNAAQTTLGLVTLTPATPYAGTFTLNVVNSNVTLQIGAVTVIAVIDNSPISAAGTVGMRSTATVGVTGFSAN